MSAARFLALASVAVAAGGCTLLEVQVRTQDDVDVTVTGDVHVNVTCAPPAADNRVIEPSRGPGDGSGVVPRETL